MNLYAIPPILTALLLFGLTFFVYSRSPKSPVHRTFSLFCFSMVVWLVGFCGVYLSQEETQALWWGRTGFFGIAFIPALEYHFILTFLQLRQPRILASLYIIGIIGSLLSRTPLIYNGIWRGFWGFYPSAGMLYPIFPLSFSAAFLRGVWLLYQALKSEENPLRRQQIRYLLLAFATGIPGVIDYIVKYKVHVYPFGYIDAFLFLSITGYAIARYRLMDINLALMRTAVFIAVYASALGLPLFLVVSWRPRMEQLFGVNWWIWLWVVCALLATAAHYANQYFQRRTEARILAEQRGYQDFLVLAAAGMLRILDLPQLLKLIVRIVTSRVKLTYAALYLQEDGEEPKGSYLLRAAHGKHPDLPESIETNDPFIHYLSVDQLPIVADEVRRLVREGKEARVVPVNRRLTSLKAAVAIPSFLKNRLVGFLILGEKLSGQVFTSDDLRVFDNLAHQAAIAIENARFHRRGMNLSKLEAADEQLSAMGHEMGNVLHIGVVCVGTLKSNLEDPAQLPPPKEKLIEQLGRAEKALLRGNDVIDDVKEYKRASNESGIHAFPLAQFFQEAVKKFQKRFEDCPNIKVILELPENLPTVEGLPTLPLLPLNLLAIPFWGVSYYPEGGTILVKAIVNNQHSQVELMVAEDTAESLSKYLAHPDRVADEVFPTRSRHGALYYFVVKKTVSDHHGRVVVLDGSGPLPPKPPDGTTIKRGTTMIVQLPLKYVPPKPEEIEEEILGNPP